MSAANGMLTWPTPNSGSMGGHGLGTEVEARLVDCSALSGSDGASRVLGGGRERSEFWSAGGCSEHRESENGQAGEVTTQISKVGKARRLTFRVRRLPRVNHQH